MRGRDYADDEMQAKAEMECSRAANNQKAPSENCAAGYQPGGIR